VELYLHSLDTPSWDGAQLKHRDNFTFTLDVALPTDRNVNQKDAEGKRPLERPRHRWEDNIKLDLREIEIDGANWIGLARVRVQWRAFVNTVMILRVL
jgi:hypothetical protein